MTRPDAAPEELPDDDELDLSYDAPYGWLTYENESIIREDYSKVCRHLSGLFSLVPTGELNDNDFSVDQEYKAEEATLVLGWDCTSHLFYVVAKGKEAEPCLRAIAQYLHRQR